MEVKDRIINDLYRLREYMLRHNSFSSTCENLTIMEEFNELLQRTSGLVLPDDGIALNREEYLKRLNKLNSRDIKRYYNVLMQNTQFNRDTFDNYLEMYCNLDAVN